MDWNCTQLPYDNTGYFSKIIRDYINESSDLSGFYSHAVNLNGIADAISAREAFPTNRNLLVGELVKQYSGVITSKAVTDNISLLAKENTFTLCTAHQPVIFTGTLYFIYKILHIIKLAETFKEQFPDKNFVPVFYMGSEDADLDELGKLYMGTEKLTWDAGQKGAVGRMHTKGLATIIDRLEGEISIHPYGKQLIQLFRNTYLKSADLQTATFKLLNELFKDFGLVVLVPDNALLKRVMLPVFEDDLFHQTPSKIVAESTKRLEAHYKVQANPRSINLFYLKDDIRELISFNGQDFEVRHTDLKFSPEEMRVELQEYPERFSPNVILRGLFQEQILPNIAFIGGGGETAYWLELRGLFEHYKTPFPVLVLRNSFLMIEKKWGQKLAKLGISESQIFQPEHVLMENLVKARSGKQLMLDSELKALEEVYNEIQLVSADVDPTLLKHVGALKTRASKAVKILEKKLLRAEKRKFADQFRQLQQIKAALFPLDGLQERIDNFIPWYARYGSEFFNTVYENSLGLEQQFVVLSEPVGVEVNAEIKN